MLRECGGHAVEMRNSPQFQREIPRKRFDRRFSIRLGRCQQNRRRPVGRGRLLRESPRENIGDL